ncbi:MAG: hypothetical protein L6R39_001664 [Caloplaca ligustica]|nr:MAG: hypothetical protein L6R39_001664 [Caloplaca ligustica]
MVTEFVVSRKGKSKKSESTKTQAVSGKTGPSPPATNASGGMRTALNHAEEDANPTNPDEEPDFDSFYLKQVTAEFADDLDKLRNASDFNENSVPILIDALKATAGVYSDEEKAKVLGKRCRGNPTVQSP